MSPLGGPFDGLLAGLVGVLALLVAYGVALIVRRRVLSRHGGTFELSYRAKSARTGRGWLIGIGRYSGEDLQWFRIFSLSPRPRFTYRRADLEFVGRRDPAGMEAYSLYSGHIVVTCRTPAGPLEVAMSPDALTGFLAWLEAAPPGRRLPL